MGCSQSVASVSARTPRHGGNGGPSNSVEDAADRARLLLLESALFQGADVLDVEILSRLMGQDSELDKFRLGGGDASGAANTADNLLVFGGAQLRIDSGDDSAILVREGVLCGEWVGATPSSSGTSSPASPRSRKSITELDSVSTSSSWSPPRREPYWVATPLTDSAGFIRPWFTLSTQSVHDHAMASKDFSDFLDEKVKPRLHSKRTPFGALQLLNPSEIRAVLHAFEFRTLSSLARDPDGCIFYICDGKVSLTLHDGGQVFDSGNGGMSWRNKMRKSTDLSGQGIPTSPQHRKTESESQFDSISLGAASVALNAAPKHVVLTLNTGSVFGETSSLFSATRTTCEMTVLEPGVALVLRRHDLEAILDFVLTERSQRLFHEEAEFRLSPAKFRSTYPAFRKCKSSWLRLIMDSIELDILGGDGTPLREGCVRLVRKGTVKISDPDAEKTSFAKPGAVLGYEQALRMSRASTGEPAKSLKAAKCNSDVSIARAERLISATGSVREMNHIDQTGPVAIVYRIPEDVLAQALEADRVFAADFEFVVHHHAQEQTSSTASRRLSFNQSTSPPKSTPTLRVNRPVTLHAVLNHPIAAPLFRKFLESTHAAENVDFYWAVTHFPKKTEAYFQALQTRWTEDLDSDPAPLEESLGAEESRARIVEILHEFVSEKSLTTINVNSEVNSFLQSVLTHDDIVDPACFAAAKEEVYSILLTDLYPRFTSGMEAYMEIANEVIEQGELPSPGRQRTGSWRAPGGSQSPFRSVLGRPGTPIFSGRKSLFSSNRNLRDSTGDE